MSQLTPQPSNVASSRPRTASMAITPTQSAVPTPAKGQTAAILHPALQNALDCLDVDLDEELSRYRRHCLIQQRVTRRRNAHGAGTQGRSGATPPPPPTVLATATAQPALSGALTGTMVASAVTTGVMDGAAPSHAISDHPQSQPSDNPDDYLESSAELLRSLAEEEQRAKAIAAETETHEAPDRPLWASVFTPLGVGSILLMILSSATLGYLILRPSTVDWLSTWLTHPDHAPGDVATTNPEQAGLPNLAPDLAAGEFDPLRANNLSSLPPFVSSTADAAEGITADGITADDTNPSNPEPTLAASPLPSPTNGNAAIASALPNPRTVITPAPLSPPSASRPVPVVPVAPPRTSPSPSTPSTVTLPPTPSSIEDTTSGSSARSSRETAANPRSGNGGNEAIAPSPSPSAASSPRPNSVAGVESVTPSPSPSTGSTRVVVAPTSSTPIAEDMYYVTTPYTGDQSLEAAQGAASGSYVRNFPTGTQVQMGAFSSASGAEEFIQNLENQGISAEVYQGGN